MEIETPKAKPGPKAKPKVDVEALGRRIHNLEELITRMAHGGVGVPSRRVSFYSSKSRIRALYPYKG